LKRNGEKDRYAEKSIAGRVQEERLRIRKQHLSRQVERDGAGIWMGGNLGRKKARGKEAGERARPRPSSFGEGKKGRREGHLREKKEGDGISR